MIRMIVSAAFLLAVLPAQALPQQQPPTQKEIDQAIDRGAAYLLNTFPKAIPPDTNIFELTVYTLIHADMNPKKTPQLRQGIEDILGYAYPLEDEKKGADQFMTYRMGVRALALHSLLLKIKNNGLYAGLYRSKMKAIQKEIAKSAQYLVDTQLDNGQWTYGGVMKNIPTTSSLTTGKPPDESEFNKKAAQEAWENASAWTGTLYKLVPKYGADPKNKKTDLGKPVIPGSQRGDNSNTQYGILGLIAAEKSGVEVPRTTWELTLQWFEKAQRPDGGFGYGDPNFRAFEISYGGVTSAGAVSLAATYKYLGRDYRNEKRFQDAVKWLSDNFSVTGNPRYPGQHPETEATFLYYHLYGIERVGAFSGLTQFGNHTWYAEGADYLLKSQGADGSWINSAPHALFGKDMAPVCDTCFAILFLKRASGDIITGSGKNIDAK